MACKHCNCCDGCQCIAKDTELASFVLQPVQQYCCKCIPSRVCVSTSYGEYSEGVGQTKFVAKSASSGLDTYEDPIMYTASGFTINGESVTFNIRFHIDEYNECYLCVDSDEIGSNDCVPVTHDGDEYVSNDFCCLFTAEWEVDISSFGNYEDDTVTVSVEKFDMTALTPTIRCANCSCICRCACITSVGTSGATTSTDCIYEVQPSGVGWSGSPYSVSLGGKAPSEVISSTITTGVESSGTYDDTNIHDDTYHVIEPSGGEIEIEYLIDTDTTEDPIELIWAGNVSDEDDVVEFWEWNWSAGYWESIGTRTGKGITTIPWPESYPLDYVGGVDDQQVKIRITSSTATRLATTYLHVKSPDCCFLRLTDEYGDIPDGASDVPVSDTNSCPTPTATWNLNDADATVVSFSCLKCDDCGTVGTPCCPDPLPTILTATVESNCYTCDEVTFPLTYATASGIWSGTTNIGGCYAIMSFSCVADEYGDFVFQLGSIGWLSCFSDPVEVTPSCDPVRAVFNATVTGVGCCPGTIDTVADLTITITE